MEKITLEPKQINLLFDGITLIVDGFDYKPNKWYDINELLSRTYHNASYDTKKYMEDHYPGSHDILSLFKGFEFKLKQIGEHRHDGQLVEYTIYLNSPNQKYTKICEEMCLANGFDAQEPINIEI